MFGVYAVVYYFRRTPDHPHYILEEILLSQPLILLFLGCLYIVLFGGLSLMRREGLSGHFAVEAIALTLVASALAAMNLFSIHPVLFLILLYLATMRVRLLVDVGNFFAMRGQSDQARWWYSLAERVWPDSTTRMIVRINRGALHLQLGDPDQAICIFREILANAPFGRLGMKYEAAAHYNLGMAYRRKGLDSQAIREFNAAIDAWPASEYARRAVAALEQVRSKK